MAHFKRQYLGDIFSQADFRKVKKICVNIYQKTGHVVTLKMLLKEDLCFIKNRT